MGVGVKKETRIGIVLPFHKVGIVLIVVRGLRGFEHVFLFNDCTELQNFLTKRRGVAGEITKIVDPYEQCFNDRKLDTLPRNVRSVVEECINIVEQSIVKFWGMIAVLRSDLDEDKPTR